MVNWIEELVESEVEVGCIEYSEEEEVRVGWIGNLEKEVMVCCDEVMEVGEVEVSWVGDLEV